MTSTLIQLHQCDHCEGQGDEPSQWTSLDSDPIGRTLAIDLGSGVREIDTCKACEESATWLEMFELYATQGRPQRPGKPQASPVKASAPTDRSYYRRTIPNEYPCFLCPPKAGTEVFTENSYLTDHLRTAHAFDLDILPRRCPMCGATMPVSNARTLIGVQRHTASVHALSMPAAWAKARDEGDPHGMVKELLSNLKGGKTA
jgi:hypothetical protein